MLCDSPNFNKLSSPSEPTSLNKKALHNLDNPISPPCVKTSFILPKTPSLTQPSSPTSLNINDLDNHLVPDVNNKSKNDSFSDRLSIQARASSSSNITRRFHPNIHHHPTIHPHNHYQRQLLNNKSNNNNNSSNKMPEECNIEASVVPNVNNNNENDNSLDVPSSCSDYSSSESNGVSIF